MYGNPYCTQMQRFQPMEQMNNQIGSQPYMQPIQPINTQMGLLGKSVDSIDVVKSMDIPLDGRISYFPLTDGSAIVTKKLQNDGTSKTLVYKLVDEDNKDTIQFATVDDLEQLINDFEDLKDLKDEFKSVKKDIKEIKTQLKTKED